MTAPLVTLPTDTLDTFAALLYALTHPESIDGWEGPRTDNPLEARLANIDAALGSGLDIETVNNLLEEKAEILTQLGKE